MAKHSKSKREEARRLYLTGEATSAAEIAKRLSVKPHTIGQWRKEEDWDGLKLRIDRQALAGPHGQPGPGLARQRPQGTSQCRSTRRVGVKEPAGST